MIVKDWIVISLHQSMPYENCASFSFNFIFIPSVMQATVDIHAKMWENFCKHAMQVSFSSNKLLNHCWRSPFPWVADLGVIEKNALESYDKDHNNFLLHSSLTGDGRNDSPGHCAKYCTYTVVELNSMEILACIVVDKRETKLVSVNMEVDAFKRVLNFLMEEKLNVVEVVTDAHSSVTKWLREL